MVQVSTIVVVGSSVLLISFFNISYTFVFTLGLLLGGAALAAVAVVLAAYTYRSSRRSKSRSAVAGRSAREIQGRAGASPGPEHLVAISSL